MNKIELIQKAEMIDSCWKDFRFWLSSSVNLCVNKEFPQDFFLGDCIRYKDGTTVGHLFLGLSFYNIGMTYEKLNKVPKKCSNSFAGCITCSDSVIAANHKDWQIKDGIYSVKNTFNPLRLNMDLSLVKNSETFVIKHV